MFKANLTPKDSIGDNAGRQLNKGKFTNKSGQLKALRVYLTESGATSAMALNGLNTRDPNVCRYKNKREYSDKLIVLNKGVCKLTKRRAEYIICNPGSLNKGGVIV